LIIQVGKQEIETKKEIPHLVLVLEPTEVKDLKELLTNPLIKNNFSESKELREALDKYLDELPKIQVEKVTKKGQVRVIE